MILSVQIQTILYAFMVGILYGFTFSIKERLMMYVIKKAYVVMIDLLYHILFVCFVYYGLYHINGGMSNYYLLLIFLVGIYLYYVVYYPILAPLFRSIKKGLKPIYYNLYLLVCKVYSIMNLVIRRKKHGKRKKKEHKQKKRKKR